KSRDTEERPSNKQICEHNGDYQEGNPKIRRGYESPRAGLLDTHRRYLHTLWLAWRIFGAKLRSAYLKHRITRRERRWLSAVNVEVNSLPARSQVAREQADPVDDQRNGSIAGRAELHAHGDRPR